MTHNDGRQLIAIGHLSDSGDLKTYVSVLHEIFLEGVLKEVGITSQLRYKGSMQKSLGECMLLPELLLMPKR